MSKPSDHDAMRSLLERLSNAAGPPGAEDEVRSIVRESLQGVGEIHYDRLGSILCEKRGAADAPRVVLDGHLDEVSFMVQSISKEGRLAFAPLGGWWGHVLLAQRVEIITERGRKVHGVIGSKPPHFLSASEREKVIQLDNMYIDIGATSVDDVEELGVQIGDPIVPFSEFRELDRPGYLSGKAFDDRVGVGLMVESLRGIGDDHPNTLIGVGAVQEEVGCRGAQTASALAKPDVAIVLEGTPADDSPGFTERQAILGKGPQIRFFDPTAISNRRLVRCVESVAADHEIPVQIAVRRSGGTNAGAIHKFGHGVPTVVIGVPSRYIHTHVSIIHFDDYARARDLVVALVGVLDRETVEGFCRFDA
ncbi:MAG: M42 family metallopeptidase [Planctomycetes bacterium]|nr:M42 family metallopeptidase [Planctomycetota bacterium]